MILDRTPLNLNEVEEILFELPESEKKQEMELFLKKFIKTKPAQAKKIKEELVQLDLMKLKPEHIIKIIDIFPETLSDLNKIFIDVSLNEDEAKQILDIVKNSK